MGAGVIRCLIFLLGLLSCSGEVVKESEDEQPLLSSEMDVVNPVTTVPVINPSNTAPTTTTTTPVYNPFPTISSPATPILTPFMNPTSTPTMVTPSAPSSSGGQSWCVASQSASPTALQVALDYACGYGGADCSAIQKGGSCSNPDTVRDHASYAFNDYYQKNPISTSCDFGGTAVITNVDPSSSTCHYPSTSTSSTVLNTTYPSGSDVYGSGSAPPATTTTTTDSSSTPSSMNSLLNAMAGLLLSLSFSGVCK